MLNPDKLEQVASELVRILETTPLPPSALGPLAPALSILARFGINLEAMIRGQVVSSLRSSASLASSRPEQAEAIASWIVHLIAWLRDERDDPPPADLPL